MRKSVKEHLQHCLSCSRNKPSCSKPTGLLLPLKVPDAPWSSISVDFITDLPLSNGFDSIMVVVDRFTKWAEFFPCMKTINVQEASRIFLREIFVRHGLPQEIVSDRGTQFVSQFFSCLTKSLGIKQCLSSAFHPQSDGQTERVNQILEHYLRCYTTDKQDDWYDWLPLAMFTYNRRTQSSTKFSPFFANYGYNPSLFQPSLPVNNLDTSELLSTLRRTQSTLMDNLNKAVQSYKKFADMKRSSGPEVKLNGWVMLNSKNLKLKVGIRKFSPKFLGPFKVKKVVNPVAYELALPRTWKVHPVFHRSLLKPFEGTVPKQLAVPQVEPSIEYAVEKILKERTIKGKTQFLIKWKHYPVEEATWQNEEDCSNCRDLILTFRSHPVKSLGDNVMNLRNSPDVPNRLLTDLSSLIVTKVNDPTSSSSKFFIRAITSPLRLHNKQKSRISHP